MLADGFARGRSSLRSLGRTSANMREQGAYRRVYWGGAAIMLQEYRTGMRPEAKHGVGVSVCFMCEDALAIYRETKAKGLHTEKPPFVGNNLWVVHFSDPDGYDIYFESPTDAPEESVLKL